MFLLSKTLEFPPLLWNPLLCYASVIKITGGDLVNKILIAITSDAISTALSKALFRYEAHICSTGTEALAMLEMLQPDILILDLMLPAIDGLTVLRKSSFRPRTIVAITNLIRVSTVPLWSYPPPAYFAEGSSGRSWFRRSSPRGSFAGTLRPSDRMRP